ncbi:anti-sigma-I factor RsgI family protein [Desulfotomaculum sp. 1211_IL3151]|uniref:anti-sigma-I factor RsgI family protein n=1 Tax=Desulfotomaculum sp. 1211_IL3151 TaxID=3084055 RepID=UPI002FD97FA3
MAKVKAVVMAHRNQYKNVLVYTEDGQYLTTRLQPIPPVGSTVYVKPPALIAKPKMLAVAAAVFLILFTGLMPNFAPTPAASAAYVNLAWQPEIGLWVDEEGKVTQANLVGLPEEEENFATTLKGQDLYTALDQLLQYSREQGTLNNKQTLVIGTLVKTDEQKPPHLTEQQLQDFLYSQLAKQGYQGAVLVTSQPQEMLQAAEKAGMPLGKYTVYEKCRQQNQPVKLDLLKQ